MVQVGYVRTRRYAVFSHRLDHVHHFVEAGLVQRLQLFLVGGLVSVLIVYRFILNRIHFHIVRLPEVASLLARHKIGRLGQWQLLVVLDVGCRLLLCLELVADGTLLNALVFDIGFVIVAAGSGAEPSRAPILRVPTHEAFLPLPAKLFRPGTVEIHVHF